MNVNEKGHIGLMKVMSDLYGKGYECFLPSHDYSAIDLIVLNKDYQSIRLQVKYRMALENKIELPLHSVVNGKRIEIDRNAIDGWAIYSPDLDDIAYVTSDDVSDKKYFALRIAKPKRIIGSPSPMFTEYGDEKRLWMAGSAANATPC